MASNKRKVIVLMGGPSAEHEVSLATGQVIINALDQAKYEVQPITITRAGEWLLPRQVKQLGTDISQAGKALIAHESSLALDKIRDERGADVVFIALHGAYGEDGTIQGLLEVANIPHTGSGVQASALAMDKIRTKEIFSYHGLKAPRHLGFSVQEWQSARDNVLNKIRTVVGLPCVIKPRAAGSSVGISIVNELTELSAAVKLALEHDSEVLAEEYIKGVEVTCAILDEGGDKTPIALPPTQIIPKERDFFDYHSKYTAGATEEITPPRLSDEIIQEIQAIALKAHEALGCAGMSRTDMLVRGNDIYVLETNTIPGMTETSLYPQAAAAVGISFPELLDKIINAALSRNNQKNDG